MATTTSSTTSNVSEALGLRRWALRVLRGEPAGAPPPAAPTSWGLFLATERCALALQRRLGDRVDSVAKVHLMPRAIRESQRVLSARAQLAGLARIATAGSWRMSVLKGGVPLAAHRDPLDLHDLDLLVAPEATGPLAEAMAAGGYRVAGTGSVRHLESRMLPESVPVELHWSIDPEGGPLPAEVAAALRPLERFPGLTRLPPHEHLWSVLTHMVIDHPDRRANLRDLLVAADAVSECDAGDLLAVERRIAGHRCGGALDDVLRMAGILARGGPGDDPFEELAATVYYLRAVLPRLHLPERLAGAAAGWALALRLGPAERARLGWRVTMHAGPSALPAVAAIEHRSPRLGRVVRLAVRATLQTLGLLLGGPIALAAGRTVKRAVGR